jgi:hypothetical protein
MITHNIWKLLLRPQQQPLWASDSLSDKVSQVLIKLKGGFQAFQAINKNSIASESSVMQKCSSQLYTETTVI